MKYSVLLYQIPGTGTYYHVPGYLAGTGHRDLQVVSILLTLVSNLKLFS